MMSLKLLLLLCLFWLQCDACPLAISSLCRCHLWLSGLQLDCSHMNFTEVTEAIRKSKSSVSKLIVRHSSIPVLKAEHLHEIEVKQLEFSHNNMTEVSRNPFFSFRLSLTYAWHSLLFYQP